MSSKLVVYVVFRAFNARKLQKLLDSLVPVSGWDIHFCGLVWSEDDAKKVAPLLPEGSSIIQYPRNLSQLRLMNQLVIDQLADAVTVLDSNSYLKEGSLSNLLASLNTDPRFVAVYCDTHRVEGYGTVIGTSHAIKYNPTLFKITNPLDRFSILRVEPGSKEVFSVNHSGISTAQYLSKKLEMHGNRIQALEEADAAHYWHMYPYTLDISSPVFMPHVIPWDRTRAMAALNQNAKRVIVSEVASGRLEMEFVTEQSKLFNVIVQDPDNAEEIERVLRMLGSTRHGHLIGHVVVLDLREPMQKLGKYFTFGNINEAVQHLGSSTDHTLLIDARTEWVDPDWYAKMLGAMNITGAGMAGGRRISPFNLGEEDRTVGIGYEVDDEAVRTTLGHGTDWNSPGPQGLFGLPHNISFAMPGFVLFNQLHAYTAGFMLGINQFPVENLSAVFNQSVVYAPRVSFRLLGPVYRGRGDNTWASAVWSTINSWDFNRYYSKSFIKRYKGINL